ncbi:MAG: hypothetical protein J7623_19660 [Chitinophaga sp.]|uniref:DUF6493 family protein n=1 Tax=Chitinophaga sp. TaxID=1869181 RepID=UPI001B2BBFF4|nr:DUF6493 family protein [Chitinophaga sp.]MBO9730866.1 hypothetical protein [Chitinophaga sp.]
MTHSEVLQQILEKEHDQEIVPFLRQLSPTERKALVPTIKQQAGYYGEVIQIRQNVFRSRMTEAQWNILAAAAFVCYDKAAIQHTSFVSRLIGSRLLDEIAPWYMAPWFDALMAELAEKDSLPHHLSYERIMEMATQQWLTLTAPMVVTCLTRAIFPGEKNSRLDSTILSKYPVTLSEHIWYLFEYPSNIYFSDRWVHVTESVNGEEEPNWRGLFKRLAANGSLDRMRLLESCLKAANRNFNKLLVGWMMDLLVSLKPTPSELMTLQPLLFQVLDSPQSKAVGTSLNLLKTLLPAPSFDYNALVGYVPHLAATGKKAIVASTIQMMDKLCKKYPAAVSNICQGLCQVFVVKEEDIQTKTAKLIVQYAADTDVALKEQLLLFKDSMLSGTQQVLQPFFNGAAAADTLPAQEQIPLLPLIGPHNQIPEVTDPGELVFLASQAFEGHESYHIDQLPAVLIALQHCITTDILLQLDPAFQRAFAILKQLPSAAGYFDQMLAVFFLNYGKNMADARPDYAEQLNIIKHAKHWWRNRADIPCLGQWKSHFQEPGIFHLYKKLLVFAGEKLTKQDALPLLSTPSHTPAWLDPVILAQRLQLYVAAEAIPDELDLQVAIARCSLEDASAAKSLVATMLAGEYQRLLEFLLYADAPPQGPFTIPSAWMQAGITKTPLVAYEAFADFSYNRLPLVLMNGHYPWKALRRPYEAYGEYNREKKAYDRYWSEETVIEISFPETNGQLLKGPAPLIQEYLNAVGQHMFIPAPDIKRLLLLTPNNPAVLLARVAKTCHTYSLRYEVAETSMVLGAIQTIHELETPPNEITCLFVACCMLQSDKTVRAYAAAYWSHRVPHQINNTELGHIIGQLESIEWAPVKRYCDLVAGSMLQVSAQHNEALEAMLTAILACFGPTPVKDLKKLLEIYSEVLSVNNSRIQHPQIIQMLGEWKGNSTLKKIAIRLQGMVKAG